MGEYDSFKEKGDGKMRQYLIIGNGVAGTTAAESIRKQDPEGTITVVTEEEIPFYYRIRLNEYISGDVSTIPTNRTLFAPVTIELPSNSGFASLTEGKLLNYCGMYYGTRGNRTLQAEFPQTSATTVRSIMQRYAVIARLVCVLIVVRPIFEEKPAASLTIMLYVLLMAMA